MQTAHSDDGGALLCMHSLQRGLLGEPCTFPGLVLHSNLSELLPGFPERRPALALQPVKCDARRTNISGTILTTMASLHVQRMHAVRGHDLPSEPGTG